MARLFNTLGDKLLGMFLGNTEAGACVPEHGQSCGTYNCTGHCVA